MPEFVDVASHFDDIPVVDAYTGAALFKAQFNTFSESTLDGNVEKKRTMSVRYGTVLPTRKATRLLGETWIVGSGNSDGFYGTPVRTMYWMKRAESLVNILTPAQAIASATGVQAYASKAYLKDTVSGVTETDYDPFWNIYLSPSETVLQGYFIKDGSTLLRVRTPHLELSGFTLAESDDLGAALVSVTVKESGAYDPVTDTLAGGSTVINAIKIDSQKFFRYVSSSDHKADAGDITLITASSLPAGSTVVVGSLPYRVVNTQPELDAFMSHLVKP